MALMSGKTYSNTGTPSNADGVDGDIFMQLDGLKTTYRKEGGVWTAFGNQLGTIPEFLKGVGVPSGALGEDDQYYRDVSTGKIYQKAAGVWTDIGSWTSLAVSNLLESNGIGADLAVTNIILNIDTFIEAGAEGYFDSATTGTKPAATGLVKVWRENSTFIYQKSQTEQNKWATRGTADAGATWSAWRITANEDGDPTRKFKALAGTASDDVVVVSQLPATDTFPLSTAFNSGNDGYQLLPSGYLMQWGLLSIGGNTSVLFPLVFDTLLNVQLTAIYDNTVGGGGAATVQLKTSNASGLSVVSSLEDEPTDVFYASTAVGIYWYATGIRTTPI